MRRRALACAVALLVAVLAFWYWPTDRRRIIAAGRELARVASIPAAEADLGRVARVAALSRLLAPGVQLVGPTGRVVIDGREPALGLATRMRPRRGLAVTIADLDPVFTDEGLTATSRTVVKLREPGADGGADSVDEREVETTWTKGDAWRLSLVTLLDGDDTK